MSSPNSLTYNSYVTQLANLAIVNVQTVGGIVQATSDAAGFNTLLPEALNYAELRIQRDIGLLALLTTNSYTLAANTNILTIPVGDFVTVETVGTVVNSALSPLLPVSKEYIQNVWGDPSATGTPINFAMYGGDATTDGDTSMLLSFGPYADVNYTIGVMGMTRALSLYTYSDNESDASTKTTFISSQLPDMLLQASMQFVSQYQRNYGAASDSSPGMAASYESAYQNLLKGAIVEEARRKWQAPAWSSQSPPVLASSSRGT